MRRDVGHRHAFRDERRKGLELVEFVHRQVGDVLGKRGLDRCRVVAVLHDDAGNGLGYAFPGKGQQRMVASLPGENFEALAIGPDKQGLNNAGPTDQGQ